MAAADTTSPTITTHHLIKALALVVMTIDHVGAYLYPEMYWWRAIGRTTFPVWFFLIGHAPQGKLHKDLWIWAAALAVLNPFMGAGVFPTNALVTLACCQLVLREVDKRDLLRREPLPLLVASLLLLLPTFVLMEYGTEGFLYALMGYAVRTGQKGWMQGKIVTITALGAFLGMQSIAHPYDTAQVLFMISATTLMTIYLFHFEYRPVKWYPNFLRPFTLYWSRHSMQYYVIHRVILQLFGTYYLGVLDSTLHWV